MNNDQQVWQWDSVQRSFDSLMNKAYIFACKRLVQSAPKDNTIPLSVIDIGAGSGLVLRHLKSNFKDGFTYLGIDLNEDGLKRLKLRAQKLGIDQFVNTLAQNASVFNPDLEKQFDLAFSNFCFYTIKDQHKRQDALVNMRKYLKPEGTFHVALPTELYSANRIAFQCIKDELSDSDQSMVMKFSRGLFLVPYQLFFVLRPIEKKVNDGHFIRFNENQIKNEFANAGLKIHKITVDYGGCAYHVHGSIS